MMSKLGEIELTGVYMESMAGGTIGKVKLLPESEQAIKDLFLELIGEDEQLFGDDGVALKMDAGPWNEKVGRNELRAELRQKVEEL